MHISQRPKHYLIGEANDTRIQQWLQLTWNGHHLPNSGVCALILAHSRNTPGAKPIIDYVDMLKALDTLCDNTPYLQTGDAKNWGFGIPKFANIDWSSI